MKDIQQQLIKNSFSTILQIIAVFISGIILPPLLIAELGLEIYGIWGLVVMLNQYSALLDLGLQSGLIKFSSEYFAMDDSKKVNSLVSSNLSFYLLLVMIGTGILIIFQNILFGIFFGSIQYQNLFGIALLYSLASLFNLMTFPFSSLLKGLQRYDVSNFIEIIFVIINSVSSIIFILSGFGLIGLVYSFSLSIIFKFILLIIFSKKLYPEFRLNLFSLKILEDLKQLFAFAPAELSVKIFGAATQTLIRFSLNAYAGIASVGIYDIAKRLVNQVLGFSSSVFIPFLPAMSTLSIQNKREEISRILNKAALFLNLFTLPIIIFLIFFFEPILKLWLNLLDVSLIQFAASILLLATISDLFTGPITTASLGFGILRLYIYKLIISSLLIFLPVAIFGNLLSFKGIIIVEAIAYFISMVFSVWFFDKLFKYNYAYYLAGAFFNVLKVSFPVIFLIFIIWMIFNNALRPHFIIFAIVAVIVTTILIFKIMRRTKIISDSEIRLIKNIFLKNA